MNKQQKLSTPYQVKANLSGYKEIDTTNRTITAVVNTYNFYDYDQDILIPGCASKSISERGYSTSATDKIKHCLFHDLDQIVGKSMDEMETTHEGLSVLMAKSYLPETTDGEDTLIKYNAGMYDQHSIGFNYVQIEPIEKGDADYDKILSQTINASEVGDMFWAVKEIAWFEWSTVAFGANKLTPYLGTKSTNRAIQYNSVIKKLDALIQKANRHDVKDKKTFELQYKQLQQMIHELQGSALLDTRKSRPKGDTLLQFYNLIN